MFKQIFPVVFLSIFLFQTVYSQKQIDNPVLLGTLTSDELNEISGLDVSLTNEGILWGITDSGNKPIIYGISEKGVLKKRYYVRPVKNDDWEDLSTFTLDNQSWILIADVGDNDAERHSCLLHFIKEPQIIKPENEYISPAFSIRFRYEDGPRDCEAVAVDAENRRIYLVTKRTAVPILYSLPLQLESNTVPLIAGRICTLDLAPRPTEEQKKQHRLIRYGGQPTAMDYSRETGCVVILTYRDFWIYDVTGAGWGKSLQEKPVSVTLPLLRQAESLCFDRTGKGVYFTTEKTPAPVYYQRIRPVTE